MIKSPPKPMAYMLGVGVLCAAMSAQATVFQMESFEVLENGNTYWLDEFDDGSPPAHITLQNPAVVDVNLYDRAYLIVGGGQLPGPEAGGKLLIDTDQGVVRDSVVNPGVKVKAQRARVSSPTDASIPAALTINDAIQVTGIFDLDAPDFGESYRVRLTDWDAIEQNESLEAGVFRRNSDGEVVALLRRGEGGAGFTVLQAAVLSLLPLPIDLIDYEQIALFVTNDPNAPDIDPQLGLGGAVFGGGFALIDSDNAANNRRFVSSVTSTLFNDRPWVRPAFAAFKVVPVPATLVLMLAGVVGMGLWRRRKG